MSLTRELDLKDSPASRFFSEQLDAARVAAFAKNGRAKLRGWPLQVSAPPETARHASALGTAFDYLVRSVTWNMTLDSTVAAAAVTQGSAGFQWFGGDDSVLNTRTGASYAPSDWEDLQRADPSFARWYWLLVLWGQIQQRWVQARHRQDELLALCVIVAWVEGIHRSGQWAAALLDGWQCGDNVEGMMSRVPAAVIDDLGGMLAFYRTTQMAEWTGRQVIQNPAFAGSRDVGGADADWIVEGVLWDMKTTKNPAPSFPMSVKQILGYALLDYDDRYHIDRVGLYYPRFGEFLEWPVAELLAELSGVPQSIAEWRTQWRATVTV